MSRDSFLDIEKADAFQILIRNSGLPNFRRSGIDAMGPAEAKVLPYANVNFPVKNEIFQESQYYVNDRLNFLHFTSSSNAEAILMEKSIRMYSLSSMEDENELLVLRDLFSSVPEYKFSTYKQKVFSLSMCNASIERDKKSLSAWRLYGKNGSGVALELEFESVHQNHWLNYLLSPIFYHSSKNKLAKNILKAYTAFSKETGFQVSNFYDLLFTLTAFHKKKPYMDEREIRLLYYKDALDNSKKVNTILRDENKKSLNKNNTLAHYVDLPLEFRPPKRLLDISPVAQRLWPFIRINKILCGYNMDVAEMVKLKDKVSQITKDYEFQPEVVPSDLFK